jgi:hypothetical protein
LGLLVDLETDLPEILAALFDGVASGLHRWDDIKLDNPPRMADFTCWVEACAPGLGREPGEFLQAYQENRLTAYTIRF